MENLIQAQANYAHSSPAKYMTHGNSLEKKIAEEEEECLGEKQRELKRSTNGSACLVLFNEPLPGEGNRGRSV